MCEKTSNRMANTAEISVVATLCRTVFLVGLTLLLMAIVRFCPAMSHMVQLIAGQDWFQKLYAVFQIQSALGREQLLLMVITLSCFLIALSVQLVGLWLWGCYRCRKKSGAETKQGQP